MEKLKNQKCVPCRGGEPPLTEDEIEGMKPQVPDWEVIENNGIKRLKREFDFKDFAQALDFTNQVGEIAEEEGHHPTILTEWGKVTVKWWTHKIKGLHQNDFIMAAKVNDLFKDAKQE